MSWSPFLFLWFGRDSGLVTAPALSSVSSVDPQKLASSATVVHVLHARHVTLRELYNPRRGGGVLNLRRFTSMELFSRSKYNIVRRSSLICLLHPHSNWGPPGSTSNCFELPSLRKPRLTVVHRYSWGISINNKDMHKPLIILRLEFKRVKKRRKSWNGKKMTVRPWNEGMNKWINCTYVSIKYKAN